MDPQNFLQSKFATVALAGMLILTMVVTAKLWIQKREVDSEISSLQSKAAEVEKNNRELSELIKYLGTEEYAERQAREKLNLQKEGEHVVVLPKESQDGQIAGAQVDNAPNHTKWFEYFFGARL